VGTQLARQSGPNKTERESTMGILLWLLGVPLSLIIVLKLFGVF
jgi:hypothetical protein